MVDVVALPTALAERKTAGTIIGLIAAFLALSIFMFGSSLDPLDTLGFRAPLTDIFAAWLAAALVATIYIAWSYRIPSVRRWILRPHWLKILAVVSAVGAGIVEESIFRKLIMDRLANGGAGETLQVAASGLLFGAAHLVWGLARGSRADALGAAAATAVLGAALGIVYLLAGRNLAPCILSHFVITAAVEPGLLIAAFSGVWTSRPNHAVDQGVSSG
jgi:membrane protease YdiL (CAAX protease family)